MIENSNNRVIHNFMKWPDVLRNELPRLSFSKQLAFMASCCARQLPNYTAFIKEERWGDIDALTEALEAIWRSASGELNLSGPAIEMLIKACDSTAPDTERFTSIFTSAALNAANSIAEALEYVRDRDLEHVVTVCCLARDTIYLYLQHRYAMDSDRQSANEFEERIANDVLMLAELRKEQEDLRVLTAVQDLTPEFVRSLRKDSITHKRGSLDVEVD